MIAYTQNMRSEVVNMGKQERAILHIDINCFFAAVAMMKEPYLRNVPLAICGKTEERHGIVLTANYIAKRQYGIKTGMVNHEAMKQCKHLEVRSPDMHEILRFSHKAVQIGLRYSDRLQRYGSDEFWLDITGTQHIFGSPMDVARTVSNDFKRELGITVSIGVADNRITAKLGSDMKKPDGITEITKENYKDVVYPLPASDLLFVGPATTRKLRGYGITTIGELAQTNIDYLIRWFGKNGAQLWYFANGLDTSPVVKGEESQEIKSVGNSFTAYRSLEDNNDVWLFFRKLAQSVAMRMKESHFKGRRISIWVRNEELAGYTRQRMMEGVTNNEVDIAGAAYKLFSEQQYDWRIPIRSLGISVSELVDATYHQQLDFFTDAAALQKREDLDQTIFDIHRRFGMNSIQPAAMLSEQKLSRLSPKETHVLVPMPLQ